MDDKQSKTRLAVIAVMLSICSFMVGGIVMRLVLGDIGYLELAVGLGVAIVGLVVTGWYLITGDP